MLSRITTLVTQKTKSMPKKSYYAVANGRSTGIYRDWDSCKNQVHGYSQASYKSFATEAEAKAYIDSHSSSSSSSSYGGSSASTPSYYSSSRSSSSSSYGSDGGSSRAGSYSSTSSSHSPYTSSSSSSTPSYTSSASSDTSYSRSSSSKSSRNSNSDSHYDHAPAPKRSVVSSSSSSGTSKTRGTSSWSDEVTVVYTDGACTGNGQEGASAGVGVWYGHGDSRNVSEPLPASSRQTNQRAELTAAKRAMEQARRDEPLEIRTDSAYLVNGMDSWVHSWDKKKSWDSKENGDLFKELKTLRQDRTAPTTFVHVKAHSGIEGNEQADRLAVDGSKRTGRR